MGTRHARARDRAPARAGNAGAHAALAAALTCASCALVAHNSFDHRRADLQGAATANECAGLGALTTLIAVVEVMLGYGFLELPLLPMRSSGAERSASQECPWLRGHAAGEDAR